MDEEEIFTESLQTLREDLEENLLSLTGDKSDISNYFDEWKRDRIQLIRYSYDICEELNVIHRKSLKTTVKTCSVSLVGGVVLIGGLFATSIISAPLVAVGGVVSALGTVCQVSSSTSKAIKSHSLVKKLENAIKKDALCLDKILKAIDQYIYRVQYLEKKLVEQEKTRKAKGALETVYFGLRFGKSVTDYFKSIRNLETSILNLKETATSFQKLSTFVKDTRIYQIIFRNTAKTATAEVAGAGTKLFGKKVFAVLGLAFDIISIVSAAEELNENNLPSTVVEIHKTIDQLIIEKATIEEIFFLAM